MARLPSRPDSVLHRNFEQGPAGNVLGTLKSSRLHLVEITIHFALVDRVAVKTRQHEQLRDMLSYTYLWLAIQDLWQSRTPEGSGGQVLVPPGGSAAGGNLG